MKNILLIGTGQMAVDYSKVLQAMSEKFIVIGRGIESAKFFKEKTGIKPITGGINYYLSNNKIKTHTLAIVATGTESLMVTMLQLLRLGVEKILIEKPAAISIDELLANEENLKPYSDKVFVAYNRRFYASVLEAINLISEDGGLQTMHFEFTEWAHKIEPLQKAKGVKENWFFANSTHVVDLAFYLAGKPKEWKAYSKSGELDWHSKTNFVGSGETEKGVLFSYISNWESAGRWAIELLTKNRRIYLKPMETISVQDRGTILVKEYHFDETIDKMFKPGLFKQIDNFINGNESNLLSIREHIKSTRDIYSKIIL